MIKNLSKKILACCLVVCMVLTLCVGAITVSAEEVTYDGTLTIGTAEVDAGAEEATVDFTTLAAKDGVAAAEVNVTLPDGATGISKVELVTEDDNVQVTFGVSEGEPLVALPGENPEDPDGADVSVYEGDVKIVDNVFTYILWVYNYDVDVTTVANTVKITFVGDFDETAPVTAAIEACKDDVDLLNLEVVEGAINVATHSCTPAEAVQENVKPATCYAEGSYDEVVYCSDETCGKEISRTPKTIDKIAHTPAEAVVENEVAATCYAKGSYDSVVYCSVEACKFEISRTPVTVDETEHTPATAVVENEVAATCLAAGSYESVVYCSVAECKHEISRTTIPVEALKHDYTYKNDGDTHSATCPNGCAGITGEAHNYVDGECVCGAKQGPVVDKNIELVPNINLTETINLRLTFGKFPACDDFYVRLVTDRCDSSYNFIEERYIKTYTKDEMKKIAASNSTPYDRYYFVFSDMRLYELNIPIKLEVYCLDANDNVIYTSDFENESFTTTVADQAKTFYGKSKDDNAKRVYSDIINLASVAQTYFVNGKDVDLADIELPNKGFTGTPSEDVDLSKLNDTLIPEPVDDDVVITPTFNLAGNPAIRFTVYDVTKYDLSNLKIVVSYTSPKYGPKGGEAIPFTELKSINPNKDYPNMRYYTVFSGVALCDGNKNVICKVYNGEVSEENLISTTTYCLENAIKETKTTSRAYALYMEVAKLGASARTHFKTE